MDIWSNRDIWTVIDIWTNIREYVCSVQCEFQDAIVGLGGDEQEKEGV